MGKLSTKGLVILLVTLLFVHFGTPLLADLFFELYHLTKIDFLYSAYGVVRYATAQFMFSANRWVITLIVGLIGLAILVFRQ